MKASKRTATGRTLALGWDQPEGEPPATPGPLPGAAPAEAPRGDTGPDRVGAPTAGRRSRRPALAMAGAIAALLALVLVLPRLLLGGATPEDPVREYLDALMAGDATTVREHLSDSAEASDVALTDEVLRAAEDRITSYTIDDVQVDGPQATVTASLSVGASAQQTSFTVRSVATSSFTPSAWELLPITPVEFMVSVPEGAQELMINGVEIELPVQSTRPGEFGLQLRFLRLLPGSYVLELPGSDERLLPTAETVSVPVEAGELSRAGAVLGYDLSETGRAEVTAQIEAVFEECAAATTADPPGCPLSAYDPSQPGSPADESGASDTSDASAGRGTWQVTAPSSYQFDSVIGASWSLGSDLGEAVFTPAPSADGRPAQPQTITFTIDGIALLAPSGELRIELSQSNALHIVNCTDEQDTDEQDTGAGDSEVGDSAAGDSAAGDAEPGAEEVAVWLAEDPGAVICQYGR